MAWEVEERVHRINVGGTRNIIDLCLEHDVRKLVYVSTVHAIPEKPHGQVISEVDNLDPALVEGSYAKTKAEATQMVLDSARQRGLHASCVHPSGLCGPGDMQGGYLTQMFVDYDQGHIPAGVKGGYSFADVRDVAAGIVACLEKGRDGTSYILADTMSPSARYLTCCTTTWACAKRACMYRCGWHDCFCRYLRCGISCVGKNRFLADTHCSRWVSMGVFPPSVLKASWALFRAHFLISSKMLSPGCARRDGYPPVDCVAFV